jgi:hypothetical protein
MKYTILKLAAAAVVAFVGAGAGQTALGQASVQTITTGQTGADSTTVTSEGTISEFKPDTIIVKTQDAVEPVRYTYSKSTTYVDQNGNAVSMEIVKSGLPVTVYYIKDGDNLVASRVIVNTSVIQPAPTLQESKTTTTTTTDK